MERYGYIRVSARDQHTDRQNDALNSYKINPQNLYVDKQSGKDFERPAYKRLLKRLRPGDLLIVKSIDRLGRNYDEILEQWRIISKSKGADILVIDMPLLDTTQCKDILGTFISDMVLQILSYCAHMERESIHQRQAEGIASAKARGVHFGRPGKEFPPEFENWYRLWCMGELEGRELAQRCGMGLSTMYRRLRQLGISTQRAEKRKVVRECNVVKEHR